MKTTAIITCMTLGELPFIRQAVDSAVQQTEPCDVLLLLNKNEFVLGSSLSNLPARVTVRKLPLMPPGLIRNIGVQESTTEWIAFLDGDDFWRLDKNERQLAYAKSTGHDAIGCRHLLVREDGKAYFYAPTRKMPLTSGMMIRRSLLLEQPFSDLVAWEDSELWKRPAVQRSAAIMCDFLYSYRVRTTSASTNFPAKRRKLLFARLGKFALLRYSLLASSRFLACLLRPTDRRPSS